MNLIEAMNKIEEGQKIIRMGWSSDFAITKNNTARYVALLYDNGEHVTYDNIFKDDWEIFKEKKKVTVEGVKFYDDVFHPHFYYCSSEDRNKLQAAHDKTVKVTLEWET